MPLPPLLEYKSITEYKHHYESHYLRGEIVTYDGIRVFFRPQKFGHAFYENSKKQKGAKDCFSEERAQRMDWIKATLEHPNAALFMGWNKDSRVYEETRRVSVVYEDFVVVIELSLNKRGQLKGDFVTCYVADNSINRITSSPPWDRASCIQKLTG